MTYGVFRAAPWPWVNTPGRAGGVLLLDRPYDSAECAGEGG